MSGLALSRIHHERLNDFVRRSSAPKRLIAKSFAGVNLWAGDRRQPQGAIGSAEIKGRLVFGTLPGTKPGGLHGMNIDGVYFLFP